MELACALVILVVGSVTAGPYGYGTKGGAVAKADARAVSGAYSGAGSMPLSIPSGASYSGSFSQSSSSSSSSSSASSSSFSYSGSGASGGGCGTGNCNAGSEGAAAAGSQANSAANAGSLAGGYGSKHPTGTYGHNNNDEAHVNNKGQDCGSESCQGTSDNSNGSGAETGSQSDSDAKAAASAGTGHAAGSDCAGSDCNNIPGADEKCASGNCGSGAKCSSGGCSPASNLQNTPTKQYDNKDKCSSGQCGSNTDNDVNSSTESDTDDINVHTPGYVKSKPSYGQNKPACPNGNCGLLSAPGESGNNKPALDLSAPKLEPSCVGSNCPISVSGYSQTKPPYVSTSNQNENQLGHVTSSYGGLPNSYGSSPSGFPVKPTGGAWCAPGTPGCGETLPFHSGPSDCTSGSCGSKPSVPKYASQSSGKPSYFQGSTSPLNLPGSSCAPGTPGCMQSATSSSECPYGNCRTHLSTPSITVNPQGIGCSPGTPGCGTVPSLNKPSDCSLGNCGAHPSGYSHPYTSPQVSAVGVTAGANTHSQHDGKENFPVYSGGFGGPSGILKPNENSAPPTSTYGNKPTGPTNAETMPGIKPGYSHGSSPSYSPTHPSSTACSPGHPGCDTSLSPIGNPDCTSGNCGGFPSSINNSNLSYKPSYPHGDSTFNPQSNPSRPGCFPGTPGCGLAPSGTDSSGCISGNCPNNPLKQDYGSPTKPGYSHVSSLVHTPVKHIELPCAPGVAGCSTVTPSTPVSADCIASGNCATHPSAPGYGGSSGIIPNYSQGGLPSFSTSIPLRPACTPGSPGCAPYSAVNSPSSCSSGSCGTYPNAPGYGGSSNIKPNAQGGLPSFSTLIPEGPSCIPGSPGCALFPAANGPSGCASGKCGTYPISGGDSFSGVKPIESIPSHSQVKPAGPVCVPGVPGCALPLAPNGLSGCTSGNCDEFPPIGGQGGFPSNKPGYSQGSSSYFPVKPSRPSCAPGAPGCIAPALNIPSTCKYGNCGTNPTAGCAPGTPGCSGSTTSIHSGTSIFPSGHPSAGSSAPQSGGSYYYTSPLANSPAGTATSTPGTSAPGYGASSVGSSSHQASYGIHNTGSLQTTFAKPSIGSTTGISASGSYTPGTPSIFPASSTTAGIGHVSSQYDGKENLPVYSGGFGAPSGILKPNEYSGAPTSSYGNKPSGLANAKPGCVSGTCDAQPSSSHNHAGADSGAHAGAGASASANAVAYTGGFGGPPGFLKPYNDGKDDIKGAIGLGTSLGLNQGVGGNSYSSGGSQGSAGAQAHAGAVTSAGASSGGKLHGGYSHGHEHGAGGCGGGCSGSGGGSHGYGGSFSLSKTGVLDGSSTGLATAGAAAKSAANASSGARAFGSSYASSSATAHAGASVKGGYGRR